MKISFDEYVRDYLQRNGYWDKETIECFSIDGVDWFFPNEYAEAIINESINTADDFLVNAFNERLYFFLEELAENCKLNGFLYTFFENLTFDKAVHIANRVVYENFPFTTNLLFLHPDSNDLYRAKTIDKEAKITSMLSNIVHLVKFAFEDSFCSLCFLYLENFENEELES